MYNNIIPRLKAILIHNDFDSVSSNLHVNDKEFKTLLFMQKDVGDWRSTIYVARADGHWVISAHFEMSHGGKKKLEDYFQTTEAMKLVNKLLMYIAKLNRLGNKHGNIEERKMEAANIVLALKQKLVG